jgi:hypothetical protein
VVQLEFFRLFKPFTKRHLEGRKRAPRFHQRASSPERPWVYLPKQKVPRPYSGAEDSAPSLTGARDDDPFELKNFWVNATLVRDRCGKIIVTIEFLPLRLRSGSEFQKNYFFLTTKYATLSTTR